jgi:hypothetical protein
LPFERKFDWQPSILRLPKLTLQRHSVKSLFLFPKPI